MRRLWHWIKGAFDDGWRWGEDHPSLTLAEKIKQYIRQRQ